MCARIVGKKRQERKRRPTIVRDGVSIHQGGRVTHVAAQRTDAIETFRDCFDALPRGQEVVAELRNPENWPVAFRQEVFSRLGERGLAIRLSGDRTTYPNLFDAVLQQLQPELTVDRYASLLDICRHAAAATKPGNVDLQVSAIRARVQRCGLTSIPATSIRRGIEKCSRADPPRSLAERFVRDHPVVYHRQQFYRFDGAIWRPVNEIMPVLTQYLQRTYATLDINRKLVTDVLANLEGLALRYGSERDLPLWRSPEGEVVPSPYIACKNGLLDLAPVLAGETRPGFSDFTPRHFSTVQLGFEFDQTAKCPRWTQFLAEALPSRGEHDRRQRVLQEFFGYCLLGNSLRLEKSLVLHGSGANGKSVVLEILRRVLGPANVTGLPLELLSNEHRPADLIGKLANIATEMHRVERLDEGIIKAIVSQEPIQLNPKYREPYTTVLQAKLIVATNTLPSFNDRSDGIFRKLLLIPFLEKFEGSRADITLISQLTAELPGIFNWAMKGAARLVTKRQFTTCGVCKAAMEGLKLHCDPVKRFIAEKCVKGRDACVNEEVLYQAYRRWCDKNGYRALASGNFVSEVSARPGIAKTRPGNGVGRKRKFTGITLQTGTGEN